MNHYGCPHLQVFDSRMMHDAVEIYGKEEPVRMAVHNYNLTSLCGNGTSTTRAIPPVYIGTYKTPTRSSLYLAAPYGSLGSILNEYSTERFVRRY